jgi:hypothetical protein
MRLTMIFSSCSLNHPFLPRKNDAVCVGDGGKVKESRDTYKARNCTFNGKEPPPTSQAIDSPKLEKTKRKECPNNACELVRCPEEAQAPWKFFPRIPVGQIEDVVGNESTFDQT